MSLEAELRRLFGRIEDSPWPGEQEAFDRFLRRKARRGRVMAASLVVAVAACVGAAVLVPRVLPKQLETVAPPGAVVRIADQGFQLSIPAEWKVSRQLTATTEALPGQSKRSVVGVELTRQLGKAPGATITVTTDDRDTDLQGASQRPDGRAYALRAGSGQGGVGQYAVNWPNYCGQLPFETCTRAARARVLLVSGAIASGDARDREQVLKAMRQIVATVQPITNALRPPPTPTVSPRTKVLLGKGGSGRAAWEAWIEPIEGSSGAGFSVHFPWPEKHIPGRFAHWESLEPAYLQREGSSTYMACLDWVPGAGRLLVGIAREDVAYVQVELRGQAPLVLRVFGRDKPVPMVAFASPRLPVDSKVAAVVAFDAAGRMIGSAEPYGYVDVGSCRPRSG